MTITEQLEKEMEGDNADNKGYDKMDDFDTDINFDSDWSYPNQRTLDTWWQYGFSVFNGYTAVVCSS